MIYKIVIIDDIMEKKGQHGEVTEPTTFIIWDREGSQKGR